MITQLTSSERQLAAVLVIAVALAGTAMAAVGVIRPGVNWIYASGAFICGELQKLSTLRRLC